MCMCGIWTPRRCGGSRIVMTPSRTRISRIRDSAQPSLSANGEWVTFVSSVDLDGVEQDQSNEATADSDVFVAAVDGSGSFVRASVSPEGAPAADVDLRLHSPSLSVDGRFVVFVSNADNLTDDPVGFGTYVYVLDRDSDTDAADPDGGFDEPAATTMTLVSDLSSRASFTPSISRDGRTVSYADRSRTATGTPGDRWVTARRTAADPGRVRFDGGIWHCRRSHHDGALSTDDGAFTMRTLNQFFDGTFTPSQRFGDAPKQTLFTPMPARPVVSDPVDTATGALVSTVEDLTAPAGASSLSLARSYDSLRDTTSISVSAGRRVGTVVWT